MNSKYGEISRAMRNRGIELFILPEVQLAVRDTSQLNFSQRINLITKILI